MSAGPSIDVIVPQRDPERQEKPLLYDAKGQPLTRPVGFQAPKGGKR